MCLYIYIKYVYESPKLKGGPPPVRLPKNPPMIFCEWTNRLKTAIFHYIQPYLKLKSKQSIDMAGQCSILMDFDYTRAKLWRIRPFSWYFCSRKTSLCSGKTLLWFDKILLCSQKTPLWCEKILLWCEKILLCSEKILLCSEKILLCSSKRIVYEK